MFINQVLDMEADMEEYITDKDLLVLLEDIEDKLQNDKVEECKEMLEQIMQDSKQEKKYIDRTYIGNVKARKRINRIAEINEMLTKMSNEQVDNVHSYTIDEYDEPNHEAEALRAIVSLSRKDFRKE